MWAADHLLSIAAAALRVADARSRAEQSVRGIDALSEVHLHTLLRNGFIAAGLGVLSEEPFPSEWRSRRGKKSLLPADSQRQRCDLVLLSSPHASLIDHLDSARAHAHHVASVAGSLFESLAPPPDKQQPTATRAQDAFWIEVKAVGQFEFLDGVPGPNRTYSSKLLRGLPADLRKIASDPGIERGAALLVHFCADSAVADHDLSVLVARCVDRGLITRSPVSERFPILDRIGNRFCTLTMIESGTLLAPIDPPIPPRRPRKRSQSPTRQDS